MDTTTTAPGTDPLVEQLRARYRGAFTDTDLANMAAAIRATEVTR